MKLLHANKNEIALKITSHRDINQKSIIFDIGLIPNKPKPKRLVIQRKVNRFTLIYSMPWRKFLKQTCIGHVCLIDKSEFVFESKIT